MTFASSIWTKMVIWIWSLLGGLAIMWSGMKTQTKIAIRMHCATLATLATLATRLLGLHPKWSCRKPGNARNQHDDLHRPRRQPMQHEKKRGNDRTGKRQKADRLSDFADGMDCSVHFKTLVLLFGWMDSRSIGCQAVIFLTSL